LQTQVLFYYLFSGFSPADFQFRGGRSHQALAPRDSNAMTSHYCVIFFGTYFSVGLLFFVDL